MTKRKIWITDKEIEALVAAATYYEADLEDKEDASDAGDRALYREWAEHDRKIGRVLAKWYNAVDRGGGG